MKKLNEICAYNTKKVDTSLYSIMDYISTENMLPNKSGITLASSLPETKATEFLKNDILISNIRPYFKKIWLADRNGCCSNDVLCIRANDVVDSNFLYYLLSQDSFFAYVMAGANGSKMPRGDKQQIMDWDINIPSISDQRRIASILSSLDKKIETNNKINANLEEMAQAIFKNWFVDFAPFKDGKFVESELGMIPEGWRVGKLGNFCSSISETPKTSKDKLIFLNTGDIEKGVFLHNNYSFVKDLPGQAKKKIARNDILYSEIRPINKHFAFVNFDVEDYVVSTKLMVIRVNSDLSARRIYQYLTSSDIITKLQTEAESRSGTFPQIRFENIKQLDIVVAPKEVEDKYLNIISSFYGKIDCNIIENQQLATLRDTLLPRLMSGEIEV